MTESAAAFDEAYTAFPDGRPPHGEQHAITANCLAAYEKKFPGKNTSCDRRYWATVTDVDKKLASYIERDADLSETARSLSKPVKQ